MDYVKQFDSYDETDPELGYSHIFKKLQLSLWRSVIPEDENDEDGQYVEAVGIATDDYF